MPDKIDFSDRISASDALVAATKPIIAQAVTDGTAAYDAHEVFLPLARAAADAKAAADKAQNEYAAAQKTADKSAASAQYAATAAGKANTAKALCLGASAIQDAMIADNADPTMMLSVMVPIADADLQSARDALASAAI